VMSRGMTGLPVVARVLDAKRAAPRYRLMYELAF